MSTEQSEQVNELAAALSKAQGQMRAAAKDSLNPHFKSRYADLASVWDACREALAANGLSVVQLPTDRQEGYASLRTLLLHSSGQYVSTTISAKLARDDAQGLGSALTYLKRYSLAAMVGVVADEDDDGNAASAQPRSAQAPARQNGAASYSGVRPAERAATPDDVRVAHAAAVAAANGRKVEPVPDGLEDYDQAGLNDWLRYYRKFAVGAAQRPVEPAAAK